VPLHETLRALNASIVGILSLPLPSPPDNPEAAPPPAPVVVAGGGGEGDGGLRVYGPFSASPGAAPPPAPLAPCMGLGIVRGIGRRHKRLYLLTPLPLETLRAHTTAAAESNEGARGEGVLLARGALQLPLVALYSPTGACVVLMTFFCFCFFKTRIRKS
jgi:hypothetical protein